MQWHQPVLREHGASWNVGFHFQLTFPLSATPPPASSLAWLLCIDLARAVGFARPRHHAEKLHENIVPNRTGQNKFKNKRKHHQSRFLFGNLFDLGFGAPRLQTPMQSDTCTHTDRPGLFFFHHLQYLNMSPRIWFRSASYRGQQCEDRVLPF